MRAGATPKTFWAALGRKSGVAPAQSGVFFGVTFSFSCRLFPPLPESYPLTRVKKVVKTKLKYVIPTFFTSFAQILAVHRRKLPVGLERPTIHIGHAIVCESGVAPAQHRVLPASKLIVAPCATSCSLGSCSVAKVTARVTHKVIIVFHAHFTFSRCK